MYFFFLLFIVDSPAIEHSSTIDMSVSRAVPASSRSIVRSFVHSFVRLFVRVRVQPLLQGRNGLPLLMPMLLLLLPMPMPMLMLLLLLDGARTAARWPTTDPAAAAAGS